MMTIIVSFLTLIPPVCLPFLNALARTFRTVSAAVLGHALIVLLALITVRLNFQR